MSLPLYQLQQALYSKLHSDGLLMGLVQGLYDVVPQQANFPYLVIGDGTQRDLPASQLETVRCEMTIELFSRAKGRKEALIILDRIYALLHRQVLTVGGTQSLVMRCQQAETEMLVAALTIRGTMQIVLLLGQEAL